MGKGIFTKRKESILSKFFRKDIFGMMISQLNIRK